MCKYPPQNDTLWHLAPNRQALYLGRMALPQNIRDLIDDFAFLDDWEERYMHVIDMGKQMPPLAAEERNDVTRVKGCVSQVWLVSKFDPVTRKLTFRGESDAHIVKGLVAIVLTLYSDRTAEDILSIDAEPILGQLGLSEHLSIQRSNGLRAMIDRIKAEARSYS